MRPLYVWVALALASVLPFLLALASVLPFLLYTYTLVNRARFAFANMIRRYLGASAEITILILTLLLW